VLGKRIGTTKANNILLIYFFINTIVLLKLNS